MTTGLVLILGASGRLGTVLAEHLENRGREVVRHSSTGATELSADVRHVGRLGELLQRVRPRSIVNMIALTDVDRCESDPDLSDLINVGPAREIREHVMRWTTSVVHVSTDHVYGTDGIHREEDVRPLNRYAQDKLRAEEEITSCGGLVLRTNFFGRSLGVAKPSYSDWLVGRSRLGVDFEVSHEVLFNPLRMTSVSKVICETVDGQLNGVFNLGASTCMSKFDFAVEFLRAAGEDPARVRRLGAAQVAGVARPRDMRMDVGKIESQLSLHLPSLESEIAGEARVYRHAK